LQDRLHAIWYCVPMDGHRPGLDLKFYKDICPDQNVPVIAVFTKHDQFLRNVKMDVSDDPDKYRNRSVSEVAEEAFQEHYLHPLGDDVAYVRLEKMHVNGNHCADLVEETAAALNDDAVMLMLSAVQWGNVELSVKLAWRCVQNLEIIMAEFVIRECLFAFPYIWFFKKTINFLKNWNLKKNLNLKKKKTKKKLFRKKIFKKGNKFKSLCLCTFF